MIGKFSLYYEATTCRLFCYSTESSREKMNWMTQRSKIVMKHKYELLEQTTWSLQTIGTISSSTPLQCLFCWLVLVWSEI